MALSSTSFTDSSDTSQAAARQAIKVSVSQVDLVCVRVRVRVH